MKKFLLCAAAAALALALVGCGQQGSEASEADAPQQEQAAEAPASEASADADAQAAAPGPVTFTDDMGNEVTVDNPQRVVACMGSFANAWELAGGTLVGAGIPVAYFEVTTFDDYERLMRVFTDITGRADLYEQNVAKVAEAIDAVVASVPAENPPTALVLTTFSGGTRVQSSGTQTGAMLADLGANNLADENRSLLSDFSLEAVIELDPDFIFVIPMGNDTEAAMRNLEEATAANPAWASLSAVQNGRYITLDPTLYLSKPNARWAEAYQGLYDNLYGQN